MPAHIVVGIGYGDEGKGLVTDHLVRSTGAHRVVRFNGGAQAAHNVVLPDGRHHTFSQFGSGTLAGADTILSKHMLVNPHAIFAEWEALRELGFWPLGKISVQMGALVTTPLHVAANRVREMARRKDRHGSCGMGIGETVATSQEIEDPLRVEDLRDPKLTRKKLQTLQDYYQHHLMSTIAGYGLNAHYVARPIFQPVEDMLDTYRIFCKAVPMFEELAIDPDEHIVFEGAQGILIDQFYGFHPHTTWSDTTPTNALNLLFPDESVGDMETITYGVMRSYMTRHGEGPFVTEDAALGERFPEVHNGHGKWQGVWRIGWTDLRALWHALSVVEVDELAVTHLDRVSDDWKICLAYNKHLGMPSKNMSRENWLKDRSWALEQVQTAEPQWAEFEDMEPDTLLDVIEAHTGIEVGIRSYGPTHADVHGAREHALV